MVRGVVPVRLERGSVVALVVLAALALSGCFGLGGPAPKCDGCALVGPICIDPLAASCAAPGWIACPDGFEPDATNPGCRPVLPAACPGGTRPALGGTCVPLGAACDAGFLAEADGFGCAPIVAAGSCPGATRAALGVAFCAPVGTCASGPRGDANVFVDSSFSSGQLDAHHVKTIAEGLAVSDAKVVDVAPGVYVERLVIAHPGVTLSGRCAEQVIVDGTSLPNPLNGVQITLVRDVVVEGVTLRGNKYGVLVQGGGRATLRDVVLETNVLGGLLVTGANTRLEVFGSLIRDGLSGSVVRGSGGIGGEVSGGATLVVHDSTVDSALGVGLSVAAGGTAQLEQVVIRDTKEDSDHAFGNGVIARGGSLTAVSSVLSGSAEMGLGCFDGATCSMTGGAITDVRPSTGRAFGRGAEALGGALTLSQVTIARCAQAGLWSEGATGSVVADHLTLRECGGTGTDSEQNSAVMAIAGSSLTLSSSALLASRSGGVRIIEAGTTATLKEVLIRDVGTAAADSLGHGVDVQSGAHGTFVGLTVERAAETGLLVDGAGTLGGFDHTVVVDTAPNAEQTYGFGVTVKSGGALELSRSAVARSRTMGVVVTDPGSTATLSEVTVSDTEVEPSLGRFGRGLQVEAQGRATVTGGAFLGNVEVAVAVVEGSTVELTHVLLAGTQEHPSTHAGRSLAVQAGGQAVLTDVASLEARQIGLSVIGSGSSLTVAQSLIDTTHADSAGSYGEGVVCADGSSARLRATAITGSDAAGLAVQNAGATVEGTRIERNAVGVFIGDGVQLQQQDVPPDQAPANQVIVSTDTSFTANGSRTSGGFLPLPADLGGSTAAPKR